MGNHDAQITDIYNNYMSNTCNLNEVKRVAWLGWNHRNSITEFVELNCPNLEESFLFDIDDSKEAIKWDINKEWNISNFDLVVCFRTSVFVRDPIHFTEQLSTTVQNNKHVFFDFLMPPLFFLKDAILPLRQAMARVLSKGCEAIVSWDKFEVSFDLRGGEELPEGYDDTYLKLHNERQERGAKTGGVDIITIPHESGYCLLPYFPSVYEKVFYNTVGYNFDRNKIDFISNDGIFLTEDCIQRAGLFLSNIHFEYMHNHRPLYPKSEQLWDEGLFSSLDLQYWKPDKHTFFMCKVERRS